MPAARSTICSPTHRSGWSGRRSRRVVEAEAARGHAGRFGAGTPRINDGSLLFLQHMISKMKPVSEGGSRLAIVFNGSPLFTGAVGSGESEIRRWILENDWLEGIVALPDQLFYNTGISTYFWILSNRKRPELRGQVVLLDARDQWIKMRKSLGDKRKEISPEQITQITQWYADALELAQSPDEDGPARVKVFPTTAFGYQRITVERPLRLRFEVSDDAVAAIRASKPFRSLASGDAARLAGALESLRDADGGTRAAFERALLAALKAHEAAPGAPLLKAILAAASVPDPDGELQTDRKGHPLPDPDLRDNENVPLGEDVDRYLEREVLPHVPDAWIDHTKTKVGYEIPFTRHFYQPAPPPDVSQLEAEAARLEQELTTLAGTPWRATSARTEDAPLVRAKWLFTERNVRGADAPLGSVISDVGVVLRQESGMVVWNPGDDLSQYKLVEPGDFVIGLRSFQHGIVGSCVRALVSPAYTVLVPVDPSMAPYLRHYLRSRELISRLGVISSGIRQGRTISFADFSRLPIPVPDRSAMDAIAAELDAREEWLNRLLGVHGSLQDLVRGWSAALAYHPGAGVTY